MKRATLTIATFLSLTLLAAPSLASAASSYYWQYQISSLPQYTTTHDFNVQYTVLSSETNKDFKVQLYQSADGGAHYTTCGPQVDTSNDPNPNATYGNSGYVPACVNADGTYTFKFTVTPDTAGGADTSTANQTASTTVDTVAPPAPTYNGKTQSGNTYVISFTSPNSSDANKIEIFASTGKTYTADSSTFVGQVTGVTPNHSYSFSYTAPDSAPRYFSVQSFDAAGNGSALVGDPGTVVHPTVFTNLNGNGVPSVAAAQEAAATAPAGLVQGANTGNNSGNGQINAPGQSSTSKNNGKVLGTATAKHNSRVWWYVWGGVLVVLILAGYWLLVQRNKTDK